MSLSSCLAFRFRHARLAGLALASMLAACGGSGNGDDPGPPAPANTAPLAAFTAPDSVAVGGAARFDAASSSDADGDALTYSWEFSGSGGDKRGGGQQIAQAFAAPGTVTVRLTVADGRGGVATTSKTLGVTAGPASAGDVATTVVVRDLAGAPLADVAVSGVGGASATTAADGRASLPMPRGIAGALRLSKAGYADQMKTLVLPAAAESGYLEATMAPREPALTLADAAAGGTLVGKDGASIVFAAGSIVDAAGTPVAGPVQVTITPIDVGRNVRAFPGRFEGLRADGSSGLILSYGTVEYALSAAGQPVQLAPGRSATIEIPSYAGRHRDGSAIQAGHRTPLWSLDETTGGWVEEGLGTVVASASSPSGFALRAEVTHFTWWNSDVFDGPPGKPKPKCLVDSNADGVLEDLTGTGYCWHAGTGPEQPDSIFASAAATGGRRYAQQVAPSQRIPAWAADAWTPAEGGVVLPIPAGLDITFRSSAKNGTLFGTKIVNLGSGVEEEVQILLEPVAQNPGTLAVTVPFDDRFVLNAIGEVDRFTFSGEAGANYEVRVERNLSSLLTGHARVLGANGAELAAGGFATGGFATVVSAGAGGTMSVEVAATAEAPGGYRVKITKILASSCGTPQTVTLPQTASVPVAAGATLCFDIALSAGDAIRVAATQLGQVAGVLTLLTPDGTAAISRGFGVGVGGLTLETGVVQAGTWRVQIHNTATAPGTLSNLGFSRLTLDGTIDLGGSASHSGNLGVTPRRYLVRPGAATAVAYKLTKSGAQLFGTVWPMGGSIDGSQTSGRVFAHPPALLPVVLVEGAQGTVDFTLGASAPETLSVDTDLTVTSPTGGDVRFWRIDGAAGTQWTIGYASTAGFQATLYGPDGLRMTGTGAVFQVYTLAATGIHTVELRSGSGAAAPLTVRVNTAAPPEPLVLGALTQRSATLAIGEVRRYAFDITRGQLIALRMTTTGLRGQAQIDGGNIYNGYVTVAPPNQLTNRSGPLYVQQNAAAVLSLWSSGHEPSEASGSVTLDIEAPTPTPAALGELLSLQVPPSTLVDWRYDIATAGKHLLCYAYTGAVDSQGSTRIYGTVWGPVARFSNYSGDIVGGGQGTAIEMIGDLSVGMNTLTLFNTLPAAAPTTARLVPIAPASSLAVGASDGGSIAACQRRYHTFAAVTGQSYTVKVTAGFAGSVRVRKVPPNSDVTARTDPPFSDANLAGTPLGLAAGVERTVTFTIPGDTLHGSGTYIVEIDGDGEAAGSYSLSLSSP